MNSDSLIYAGLLLLLILAVGTSWILTVLSLPGNWAMVITTALFACFSPEQGPQISWVTVGVLVALALLAELLEFAAGAVGAARVGGSKRGAVLAIVGAMTGAILGAAAGTAIPIPLIGSMIGAIGGASLGALAGAMIGEAWKGRSLGETWKVGQAAFWGRLLGTVAKTILASAMAVIAVVDAIL